MSSSVEERNAECQSGFSAERCLIGIQWWCKLWKYKIILHDSWWYSHFNTDQQRVNISPKLCIPVHSPQHPKSILQKKNEAISKNHYCRAIWMDGDNLEGITLTPRKQWKMPHGLASPGMSVYYYVILRFILVIKQCWKTSSQGTARRVL